MIRCPFCGREVSPTATGTYRLVEGWVEVRREGGGHAIALPSEPKGFAHGPCVRAAAANGGRPTVGAQGSLFAPQPPSRSLPGER